MFSAKRVFLSLIIFASAATALEAVEVLAEAKAGYFYPTDHQFRKIYSGGGIYGVELSCQTYRDLYAWASGNYFTKSGHSIGENNHTKVTIVPVGFGLKYMFPTKYVDPYVGMGILGTYFHTKNHSPFVFKSVSKWGVGGIWKLGAIIKVYKGLFLDLFADYSYMKIDFHDTDGGRLVRSDVNLSGISAGAGIGYRL